MVEAVGAAADCEDGRSLDALGYGKTAEEVPPACEVGDEVFGRPEEFLHQTFFTADLLLKRAVGVPVEDVFGRRFFPSLDESAE